MTALKLETYDWKDLVDDICQKMGEHTGNVLAEKQKPMVESRMRRRLMELKIQTPVMYRTYWQKNLDSENKFLTGLLTTHFTSFFREFTHFEWLASYLPTLVQAAKAEGRRSISFWSAACSNGQEVWSLCMWLHHHMPKIDPSMKWEVFGTDIDPESVKTAENGVYHRRELETAPRHLWEGLWVRGKDDIQDWYRINKELRSHAKFKTMNLLNPDVSKTQKFDVVMCRNVLIYFDQKNQKKVAQSLSEYLTPQGALITGLSESLTNMGLAIKGVHTSVYKLQSSVEQVVVTKPTYLNITKPVTNEISLPNPLKVFCIDDSATVITILKKVLNTTGFEVIGIASNGAEAIEKLKTLKPDIITLDLHMPVMDGSTFLKESKITSTIPVVVVSSVGRDDDSVVSPLFALGVSDFVEKPTLSNMGKIGEELLQKLKMSWTTKNKKNNSQLLTTIVNKKSRPAGNIVFNVGSKDFPQLEYTLRQQSWSKDHLTFVVDPACFDQKVWMETLKSKIPQSASVKVITSKEMPTLKPGFLTIWVNYKGSSADIVRRYKDKSHLVITEECAELSKAFKDISDDVAPYTSISYNLDKLLGGE